MVTSPDRVSCPPVLSTSFTFCLTPPAPTPQPVLLQATLASLLRTYAAGYPIHSPFAPGTQLQQGTLFSLS
jgi:hypothetical protein